MPKIMENLRDTILKQSGRLLLEKGYEAFTMRDAAGRCGIAVGTLYNYFKSKDELAASIMLDDWRRALRRMKEECDAAVSLEEGLAALYRGVTNFSAPYRAVSGRAAVFRAARSTRSVITSWRHRLRR